MPPSDSPRDVNIGDGLSLYEMGERVKQLYGVEKAPLNYSVLHQVLTDIREEHEFRLPASSILPISYDPKSEAQNRFLTAVKSTKFTVDPVDYRDLFVSLPPGLTPKPPKPDDDRPLASFASRIAYVLGRLSRHSDPHILVVSHCYEILWPLQNIKLHNPSARVGVAYFEKFLDIRWQRARMAEANGSVEFFPIDRHVPELFGIDRDEVESRSIGAHQRREVTGLNSL